MTSIDIVEIKCQLLKKNMLQKDLAEQIGMKPESLSRELKKGRISMQKMIQIKKILFDQNICPMCGQPLPEVNQ